MTDSEKIKEIQNVIGVNLLDFIGRQGLLSNSDLINSIYEICERAKEPKTPLVYEAHCLHCNFKFVFCAGTLGHYYSCPRCKSDVVSISEITK